MKYIKLFEDIKHNYVEINFDTYSNLLFFNNNIPSENFTQYEISEVESVCGKMKSKTEYGEDGWTFYSLSKKFDEVTGIHYSIDKLFDEYFLISWHCVKDDKHIYYKCDQLESLISCLKKIIKK